MQFWTITFMFGRFIVIWGWIRVSIEKVAKYLYECELIYYKRLPSWSKSLAVYFCHIYAHHNHFAYVPTGKYFMLFLILLNNKLQLYLILKLHESIFRSTAISLSTMRAIYIWVCLTATNRILIRCPWAICVMYDESFHNQKAM